VYVYFVQIPGTPIVKIGKSANPKERIREIQTYHPYPLTVIATIPGEPWSEAAFHRFFSPYRLRGEWFSLPEEFLSADALEQFGPFGPPEERGISEFYAALGRTMPLPARPFSRPPLWGWCPLCGGQMVETMADKFVCQHSRIWINGTRQCSYVRHTPPRPCLRAWGRWWMRTGVEKLRHLCHRLCAPKYS
jgi:hypothetical protein